MDPDHGNRKCEFGLMECFYCNTAEATEEIISKPACTDCSRAIKGTSMASSSYPLSDEEIAAAHRMFIIAKKQKGAP